MSVVNQATGEIATVDQSSEMAVTSYLQQARDWIATAVDSTGPEQIAAAKAQIATAAEATKQLGLSKEIREDAAEMVRRAEYALRKSVTKAQESGDVADRGNPLFAPEGANSNQSPMSFFGSRREYDDANAMGSLDADEFEDVLEEAKDEGNLSRANIAAKAREKSEPRNTAPRATPRRALTDQFFDAAFDAVKKVESLHRLIGDDRFPQNAEKVAAKHRNDLLRAKDLFEQVINALPNKEYSNE